MQIVEDLHLAWFGSQTHLPASLILLFFVPLLLVIPIAIRVAQFNTRQCFHLLPILIKSTGRTRIPTKSRPLACIVFLGYLSTVGVPFSHEVAHCRLTSTHLNLIWISYVLHISLGECLHHGLLLHLVVYERDIWSGFHCEFVVAVQHEAVLVAVFFECFLGLVVLTWRWGPHLLLSCYFIHHREIST